jgi:hypothetical protein
MKKILLVAAVAAFAMTSCKKEYTCECITSTSSGDSETESVKFDKMKKKDAEKKCDTGDASFSFFGETITTECKIK